MASATSAISEYLIKTLIVGADGSGKSSIVRRMHLGIFRTEPKKSIGVDFGLKVFQWGESSTVRIQMWDIEGQELGSNRTNIYYKGAQAAFVVFDRNKEPMANPDSESGLSILEHHIQAWKNDLDSKAKLPDGTKLPVILLANKSDLPHTTTTDKINEWAAKYGFDAAYEISVKDDDESYKVQDLFAFNPAAEPNAKMAVAFKDLVQRVLRRALS